ncbi:MAG: flagellar biosynthesis protein FliR [Rickettsiaceae bacterium]|jgi:flagellar biosynthetic protein FliR|nr:flagellar biosynthesis protein FliR [Rickettsiaceae bacterium]
MFLVFCRVGGAIRFLPALGEVFFPMTIRVAFSLALSMVIYPLVSESLANVEQPILMVSGIIKEAFIGVFIGLTIKLTFQAIHVAAVFIATQSGLAFATLYDPSQREQSTIIASLISILVLTAIFISDTHHLYIKAIIESYNIFHPSSLLNTADFSASIVKTLTISLEIALKIAAPYFLLNLIITICNGILSRLMPSFQVFFVMTPLQVLITYLILFITINSTIELEVEAIRRALLNF